MGVSLTSMNPQIEWFLTRVSMDRTLIFPPGVLCSAARFCLTWSDTTI
jgi:hypothetical protein